MKLAIVVLFCFLALASTAPAADDYGTKGLAAAGSAAAGSSGGGAAGGESASAGGDDASVGASGKNCMLLY